MEGRGFRRRRFRVMGGRMGGGEDGREGNKGGEDEREGDERVGALREEVWGKGGEWGGGEDRRCRWEHNSHAK